jgi:putative membrane-bound dehydrogenase-like protein
MSRLPLALLLLLPIAADAADLYNVGVSQVDITPTHPIRLNGFGGRRTESEGVYQRIWARAIAIEDENKQPALLITVDVLGIPDDIRAALIQRFARQVKPERIAITATHTHTGPMLKGANTTLFGVPIPKEHLANIDKYTAEFLDKLEQAGLEALKNRKPAKLSYAIGSAKFAINRRTASGPVDHDLPTLFVHDPDGKLRAIYTSYACHCVTLSHNKIGGDWAGFAAEEIQSALPGVVALVSVGCGADSNPSSGVTGDKIETAKLQGREIANEIKRLSSSFRTPVTGKLTTQWKQLELPLAASPTREQWEEKAKRQDAIGHHARVQLEKLDRKESLPTKVDYPIQTWSFTGEPGALAPGASAPGALAMVFLPGEVVVDYSLRLKKELDGQRLWVNAYANGAPCYIPSERILKEGGYEGGAAMIYYDLPVPFKPGLEESIVSVVKEQLAKTFPPKFDGAKVSVMPLSPQQSLVAIKTKPNLVVELVACEPLVDSPVAIDFGPDGKLWVCEMIDYPQGKTGKFEAGGRISFLEDLDGDGRMDKRTTFLDGLPFPTGVKVWRKGVLICAAPDILFAEDTNGDGKADVVKKLFSGFGTDNYQGRVNGLEYGLDGWVYGSCGLFGGRIKSFNGKEYALGNRDFRIKPDTGEMEPVSGTSQQGRVRDDWGNWFGCDNSTLIRHYPLDDHYLKRNPHVVYPNSSVFVPADPNPNRLFPINQQAQRFALSGPAGNVTAACGLCIYRDNLLGEEFRGNAFVCEPVNLVVHRLKLTPKGSTFEGHRPDDEKDREFLASTDNWFRPVQATTGPDGCLWIVDMYRHVIEHPRWIPPQDAAKLDLRAGAGMGRIYRVRPKEKEPRSWHRFDRSQDADQFLRGMAWVNGWTRDIATQMVLWGDGRIDDKTLENVSLWKDYAGVDVDDLRLHCLAVLNSRGAIVDESFARIFLDKHPHLRRWAIRCLESQFVTSAEFFTGITARVNDPDPLVRLQAAYSLGRSFDPKAADALGRMAAKNADDPYMTAAVLSSVNPFNISGILDALLRESGNGGPPPGFVSQLMRTATGIGNSTAQIQLLNGATVPKGGKYARWQFEVVASFIEDPKTMVRFSLLRRLDEVRSAALRVAADPKSDGADRIAAIKLVGYEGDTLTDAERAIVTELLSPTSSPALRSATVSHLGKLEVEDAAGMLIQGWKSHTPATRTQILDVLLARKDGAYTLVCALMAKAIGLSEIDAARRQRLLTHSEVKVRERAAKVFDGTINADRAKVLKEYADTPTTGDATKGKAVFTKVCAACHKLGDVGAHVGPDLAALANRTPAYLLQEILDPNRNLDSRYLEYQAVTKGMRTVTGLLAGETSTSIILRGQQRKDETLLRTDIEELRGSGKSLMPEGLEKDLPKKDMADLLAFITAIRTPPKAIAGNTPTLVKPVDGRLTLRAANAEIYGNDITFEPEFKNIGYWHGGNDRAEWRLQLEKAGSFDVYLDYACDAGNSGSELLVEPDAQAKAIQWKVASTGTWSQYRTTKVGTIKLQAGEARIVVRPVSPPRGAMVDLKSVLLVPAGEPLPPAPSPKRGGGEDPKYPTDASEIAKLILDDTQPAERRNRLIADNTHQSSELIVAMAKDIKDAKEEYRRIPWIWRVAIAAGKRNNDKEIRAILDVSLPREKLQDWQAVVIGGGIINGLTQAGVWPGERIEEIIGEGAVHRKAWQNALKQAFTMADDEKVPMGTRYDALRMIALAPTDAATKSLSKYLGKDVNAELQMGAVSGLGDVHSPKSGDLLIKSLGDLTAGNRTIALDALLRTPGRAKGLLSALATGTAKFEWLTDAYRKSLLMHPDSDVRREAGQVLK